MTGKDDTPAGWGWDSLPILATSCWGRRQRITQPKALNLLMKLPEATLSLILLFSEGTGQRLPLTPWGSGWRGGRALGLGEGCRADFPLDT